MQYDHVEDHRNDLRLVRSPLLQVALADALLSGGNAVAIEAVRGALARQDLDPTVRDYLQMALDEVEADAPPPNTGV